MHKVCTFFSNIVVNKWNMLDQQTVEATSLNVFKMDWIESQRQRCAPSWIDPLSTTPLWLEITQGEFSIIMVI